MMMMFRGLLILAAVMIAIAAVYCGLGIVFMARMLILPKRMTGGRALLHLQRLSPADLGLDFQTFNFRIIDESTHRPMTIAGWWIDTPHANGRCAVILHGYSDAKVGGIAWAPLLRDLGFAILAIDLRAHGESGGDYCTGGYWERQDVNQVLDQLKTARPSQTRQILLFGISLGAAVAAATAALRSDIWAVILECPYSSFHNAAARQGDRLGTPGRWFQEPAFRLAEWLARADFDAVHPIDTIPQIPCPVMVIQSRDDPFLSEQDLSAVKQAVESRPPDRGPSVCWELPQTHHIVAMREDPAEYRRRIEDFLSRVLQNTPAICDK
jgi:uncharacterized protein